MVSEGSLHEEDGILPDWPYVWESDDAITPPPFEADFNSNEDLVYEVSGCPTIRRLQRVALHHKYRAYALKVEVREWSIVARLELWSQKQAQRISKLSTFIVQLAMEQDEGKKVAHRWKLCNCVLAVIVWVSVLAP